jgi:hypothetical protein
MGKSMYNFGKQTKEKARQQKQMDKASKRLMAKQNKAKSNIKDEDSAIVELSRVRVDDIVKGTV